MNIGVGATVAVICTTGEGMWIDKWLLSIVLAISFLLSEKFIATVLNMLATRLPQFEESSPFFPVNK